MIGDLYRICNRQLSLRSLGTVAGLGFLQSKVETMGPRYGPLPWDPYIPTTYPICTHRGP